LLKPKTTIYGYISEDCVPPANTEGHSRYISARTFRRKYQEIKNETPKSARMRHPNHPLVVKRIPDKAISPKLSWLVFLIPRHPKVAK